MEVRLTSRCSAPRKDQDEPKHANIPDVLCGAQLAHSAPPFDIHAVSCSQTRVTELTLLLPRPVTAQNLRLDRCLNKTRSSHALFSTSLTCVNGALVAQTWIELLDANLKPGLKLLSLVVTGQLNKMLLCMDVSNQRRRRGGARGVGGVRIFLSFTACWLLQVFRLQTVSSTHSV